MNKKAAPRRASWGLTVILAIILFWIILLLISFMSTFGLMGVKAGIISPTYLIERPGVIVVAVCVISLSLSIVVMAIVQKMLISPIVQMAKAMQKLADGRFDTRIQFRYLLQPREIAVFSDSFNKTAEALGSVEILRTDFINNFSHEFKTPIHSLIGVAELLRSGDCSPAETGEYLDIIIDQSKRLASLASNVLYLTKLETGASPVEMDTLNLSELLRQALVTFDYRFSEKELELETEIQEIRLYGNADLLTQMISNILGNAVKFSFDRGRVEVDLLAAGDKAVYRVTDHGCGMDEETIRRIFDKFYQGDTSHSAEGFGLGLPMVKKIVDLHKGKIVVNSQPGKGSVFSVELPLNL